MSTDEEFSDFVAAYAAWSRVPRADDPVAYVHGVLMKSLPAIHPVPDDTRGSQP